MTQSVRRHLWLPLLAFGCALALIAPAPAPAHAQSIDIHAGGGAPPSIQITFGSEPRWVAVPGSQVRIIEVRDRPDYDIFRCGNRYYVYRGGEWYVSRRPHGRYVWIDEYRVPVAISRVPRGHWRRYPGHWDDHRRDPRPRRGEHGRGGNRDEHGDQGHGNGDGGSRRYK